MAVTAEREYNPMVNDGARVSFKLKADGKAYKGAAVGIDITTGYADNFVAAKNIHFAGIAEENVDNTGGSAGDKSVNVKRRGPVEMKGTNLTQSGIGRMTYIQDNEMMNFSGSWWSGAQLYDIPGGVVVKVLSTTRQMVDITDACAHPSNTARS